MTPDKELELIHFGVKGMRWGVRKAEPINSAYTTRMQGNDKGRHGKRAVKRINRRLNEGMTRDKALEKEDLRNAYQRLALLGGVLAASLVADYGSVSSGTFAKNYVGNKANANRAAAKVAENTMKIGSKAAKLKYAKPGRGGAYKITTL